MEIKRDVIQTFKRWKNSSDRKPMLLKGARQIGKTWALETFGRECYSHYALFDFDRQPELKSVFTHTKEPQRIVKELAAYSSVPLLPEETLIIFDEIQECEEALNALKYFYEEAPEYHVAAAGSLLGVAVKKRRMAVPVGKVNIIQMFPLTFKEFLSASDRETYQFVDSIETIQRLPEIVLNKLLMEYRRYLVCGGMPEVVVAMLENKGGAEVERRLDDILQLYELDFAKYAEAREIPRISSIWHSLPTQLAKENKKFIYKALRPGARSKDYEDALMWLVEAGLIYRIYNISKPGLPLAAYEDMAAFKIYACDCGLLRRLANLPATIVIDPSANYTEFKGAMAENAVLQNLAPSLSPHVPYYWTSEATAEVEFVIQWQVNIIPVEVKAESNISSRSLALYNNKYHPWLRIKYSSLNLHYNGNLLSCPSPLAAWFENFYNILKGQENSPFESTL